MEDLTSKFQAEKLGICCFPRATGNCLEANIWDPRLHGSNLTLNTFSMVFEYIAVKYLMSNSSFSKCSFLWQIKSMNRARI